MHIESSSTGERRIRLLIFLAMCSVFSGWFAYDGMKGYPKSNLASFTKEISPEMPDSLKVQNPRVTGDRLNIVQERLKKKEPVTRKDLMELMGVWAWEQEEELTYVGSQWTATARLAQDKVVSLTSRPAGDQPTSENTNYLVRPDRLGQVRTGMTRDELRDLLGKPSKTKEKTLWYIGPAAFAGFPIADEKVVGEPLIRKSEEHSESDIFMQKVLAGMLAVGSLFIAIKFLQVLRLRILLDDGGLHVNNKLIAWDSMVRLKTDEYLNKGWVDLVYRKSDKDKEFRLDSYHISRFKELIQAICERKGFVSPLLSAKSETPTD